MHADTNPVFRLVQDLIAEELRHQVEGPLILPDDHRYAVQSVNRRVFVHLVGPGSAMIGTIGDELEPKSGRIGKTDARLTKRRFDVSGRDAVR